MKDESRPFYRINVRLLVPQGLNQLQALLLWHTGAARSPCPEGVLSWCPPLPASPVKPQARDSAPAFPAAPLSGGAPTNLGPAAVSWDPLCICGKGKGGALGFGERGLHPHCCVGELWMVWKPWFGFTWQIRLYPPVAGWGVRQKHAQGCRLRLQC